MLPLRRRFLSSSVRNLFITTEETPNPNTIKFLPGRAVLPAGYAGGQDFRTLAATRRAPLARELMLRDGVAGVFLGPDFVSVTMKDDPNLRWAQVKPLVFSCLMDFFAKDTAQAVLPETAEMRAEKEVERQKDEENDTELVLMIKELLEEKVRPMARDDGGDVIYRGFDEKEGVVKVQLVGSCVGCPSSTITLKNGVENM
jgi:Fe-S cluster biogenesis protein NfuA